MSEKWPETEAAWNRARQAWGRSTLDKKIDVTLSTIGLVLMASAIIRAFGWPGLSFCIGLILNYIGRAKR